MLAKLEPHQQTLLRAAEIIRERGLHKHGFGNHGEPRCTLGAIAEAANCLEFDSYSAAVVYLQGRVPSRSVIRWNDAPGRTAAEVIKALTEAALT